MSIQSKATQTCGPALELGTPLTAGWANFSKSRDGFSSVSNAGYGVEMEIRIPSLVLACCRPGSYRGHIPTTGAALSRQSCFGTGTWLPKLL